MSKYTRNGWRRCQNTLETGGELVGERTINIQILTVRIDNLVNKRRLFQKKFSLKVHANKKFNEITRRLKDCRKNQLSEN